MLQFVLHYLAINQACQVRGYMYSAWGPKVLFFVLCTHVGGIDLYLWALPCSHSMMISMHSLNLRNDHISFIFIHHFTLMLWQTQSIQYIVHVAQWLRVKTQGLASPHHPPRNEGYARLDSKCRPRFLSLPPSMFFVCVCQDSTRTSIPKCVLFAQRVT